jgi:predicted NBD/HSP70 family sugar kinase
VIVGLDVRDKSLRAVVADDRGGIASRDSRDTATAGSAVDVMHALGVTSAARVGAAVRDPSLPISADIIAAAAGAGAILHAPRVVTQGAAIALAEQWCGAARGLRHVVALTADDCVLAGVVIDGRIFEGAHGLAGAAGWLALNPVERDDYRRLGCLEAEIGAAGIVRRLVWRVKAGDPSRALDLAGGDLANVEVQHVFEAARAGDGVAISVVRDTARYIGMAISNLVAMLDPEIVVLGGLIADARDLLLAPAQLEASRRVAPSVAPSLQIVAGTLGADAAALGAARAAMLG